MPKPGESFNVKDLSDLFCVNHDVIRIWWEKGVGPAYFDQELPDGVKRFCTAEAIRDFCLRHRVMRREVLPAADHLTTHSPAPNPNLPLLAGGAFPAPRRLHPP